MSKKPTNWGKLMEIANTDRKLLHIFWTTWENSIKFSGKMCFKIILILTKNQGFTFSLENTFCEKPPGWWGGGSNCPPPLPPAILGLKVMKNALYFALKALWFLRYLNFCPDFFVHPGKQLVTKAKINLKIYDITKWETNNYITLIA